MRTTSKRCLVITMSCTSLLALPSCSGVKTEAKYPTGHSRATLGSENDIYKKPDSIFGKDGLSIFGGKKKNEDESAGGIGVNAYLWRASLDIVSFMPLASADPFGGVILTDWYSDPAVPDERIKLNVFIEGKELKASALSVKAFRQVTGKGGWTDAPVTAETTRKLEDSILTRARELRVSKLASEK